VWWPPVLLRPCRQSEQLIAGPWPQPGDGAHATSNPAQPALAQSVQLVVAVVVVLV
jgi:hypothetical protein